MGHPLQTVSLVLVGTLLLWFGYTLFVRLGGSAGGGRRGRALAKGVAGAPRTCPVCSCILERGERVKSAAFPQTGARERLLHVFGCPYCYGEDPVAKRRCPVCGAALRPEDYLVARLFERPGRSHVHVIGCTRCRGPGRSAGN